MDIAFSFSKVKIKIYIQFSVYITIGFNQEEIRATAQYITGETILAKLYPFYPNKIMKEMKK